MTIRRHGCLVLVVGPSGAGKDSLIDGARARLVGDPRFGFPRRVVTRPASAGGEDHIAMAVHDFVAAREAGRFCLAWGAHGLLYGVPVEAMAAAEAGTVVVVNGSRGVIETAEQLGVPVAVLHVTARPETLAARLAGRGRESAEDVAARLAREKPLVCRTARLVAIDNDGALAEATQRMVDALVGLAALGSERPQPVT